MDIYLSGTGILKKHLLSGEIDLSKTCILESFYSVQSWQIPLIEKTKKFMLDSGAFTFRQSMANGKTSHSSIDWDKYADDYADFVKKHNIKLFFELDIDNITNLSHVEYLRKRIESKSGKKSIPVWHINRGKEYFIKMCQEYPYVAIGGLTGKSVMKKVPHQLFPWFIDIAHKYGAKIHGLGYTQVSHLKKYHFDSVDSTTWIASRYGETFLFTGDSLKRIHANSNGRGRLRTDINADLLSFKEWMKLQQYADKFW